MSYAHTIHRLHEMRRRTGTLVKGDDILTDMGYQNLIRRILSDTIEMPEHVGNMTAADLTLYLNGYATAQKRIVQMIKELSEGPGDR